MKKTASIFVILFITVLTLNAQETEFKPNGKVHFKVFWNYHSDLSSNASKTSAFELKRSYFGYTYAFSKEISAKITFDVGSNSGGSAYTAFLKVAQVDWKVASGVKLSMGMIGLKQWNDQEKFWGYRYIFKTLPDEHGFGSSADLGINAEFSLAENLKANLLIINGEGYKKVQDSDGKQKIGGSLVFTPVEGLTTKVYVDSQPAVGSDNITTMALFAGYKTSSWRLGVEYNKQTNATKYASPAQDKDLDGLSIYSTYTFSKKVEIFGRFDQLGSNTLSGESENWNINKDGTQIITGIQFAPVKGFSFSLNYQGYSFDDSSIDNSSEIFINAEFKL
jgi:hypothetical protein